MKKDRKSNIELLRIVSMFMIVFSHVTWEGRFSYPKSNIPHNTIIQFPWLFGQIGVIVFTLISAYFLSKKKEVNVKSISKLAKITWFWSILALMVAITMGGEWVIKFEDNH
ncbi:acyltransferase family protein [Ligilactobacillus salivarius]|uniref:acyltransferase family protein n=1 Tax=Ligilactobacillus salivarius TaxID=1624 RepID=UPI0024BB6394|nr:acyltransferase family protein [Ligilactobacillus salivarius]WHS05698.1 acyltransferase family protein [Ligilactobacillus salivarius]WHS08225.1 acyltransferase family protein [Ligilactobacillus salivarius]WNB34245.1 acyltransferase family protein [Ligilactobacillus salivarius]